MQNKIDIELKWNNTCCRSICPISGDRFRPYWGLYPFILGTFDPISIDALADIDPESVDKILKYSNENQEPTSIVIKLTIRH